MLFSKKQYPVGLLRIRDFILAKYHDQWVEKMTNMRSLLLPKSQSSESAVCPILKEKDSKMDDSFGQFHLLCKLRSQLVLRMHTPYSEMVNGTILEKFNKETKFWGNGLHQNYLESCLWLGKFTSVSGD